MAYSKEKYTEEEIKAMNREKTRRFRERQKAKRQVDPELDKALKDKRREEARKRRSDPEENARILEWQRKRHAVRVKDDPEYAERKRASQRTFYWNNREQLLAEQKAWREENDRSEYNLEWSRANRDKRAESHRRRRALLKGATDIEPFTKQEVWERDNGLCGICLELADSEDWHLDHVIPLSKGGQHVLSNVQVSHPKCNLSKGDKILPFD